MATLRELKSRQAALRFVAPGKLVLVDSNGAELWRLEPGHAEPTWLLERADAIPEHLLGLLGPAAA